MNYTRVRTYVFVAFSVLILRNGFSQNLLSNPGFESFSSCPNGPAQINFCNNWGDGTGGTSDYFNSCGSYTSIGSPPPTPFPSGTGCVGFYTGTPFPAPYYNEYISQCLSSPMANSTTYTFSFDVYSTLGSTPTNKIVIWGRATCVPKSSTVECPSAVDPGWVVLGESDTVRSNSFSWTTMSVTFTTPSIIRSVMIGGNCPPLIPNGFFGYIYLDDVSITLGSPCGACPSGGSGATWTWTGCQNTDWFNACNWDRQSVPTVSSNVIIPSVTNDPLVNSGTANCLDITIQTGATVNINSTGGAVLNVTKP